MKNIPFKIHMKSMIIIMMEPVVKARDTLRYEANSKDSTNKFKKETRSITPEANPIEPAMKRSLILFSKTTRTPPITVAEPAVLIILKLH
jgi:hypothetical protein